MTSGNFSPKRPALVLLSGLPGAGKTTFARELGTAIDLAHFESDAVRRGIAAAPTYSAEESARVFQAIEDGARAALVAGRHALVDATNLTRPDRRRFHRLAASADALLVAVRLTAPEEVVRERLSRPREGNSEAGPAVYDLMGGRAQAFTVPAIVVDTRFDLGASIALVARLIERGNG